MNIIADSNIPLAKEFFSLLGNVTLIPPRELSAVNIKDADALIVRSVVRIDETLLKNSKIKFVGSCTAGVDHLDTDYMDKNNIGWSGAPGCNANAVVEYVLSVFASLYLHHNIDWRNKSVGIVGGGNVGGRLYQKLKGMGLTCQIYDPFLNANSLTENIVLNNTSVDLTTLEIVLSNDIVCLHAPLTHHEIFPSFHLIGEQELALLKDNSILINAGRGAVIDNQALLSYLKKNKKQKNITAVLDVWETEPLISQELLNIIDLGTPHIAGHSYEGKALGTEIIYKKLCAFLKIDPAATFTDFDSGSQQVIKLNVSEKIEMQLNEAILGMYDVRQDDKQLRSRLALIGEGDINKRKQVFDDLRKNYRKRREFSNCMIEIYSDENNKSQSKKITRLAADLEYLGFVVKN